MVTAQIESFSERLQELKPILPVHYEELALDKDSVPLDPQFDLYLAREARGEVLFVTLRENGTLIGYFIGFIAPGLHYRTCLTLTMDIFYVHPSHRGKSGGMHLFKCVKREALRRGVNRWFVGHKTHMPDASRLFLAMGFREVETYYSMILEA